MSKYPQKNSNGKKTPSPEAKKKLVILILSFLVICTGYGVLLRCSLFGVIDCLYIVAAVLFVIYFYLTTAMSNRLPEKSELNPDWSDEKKDKFLVRIKKNKQIANKLSFVLLPLMAVVAFDIIYRFFISKI